MINKNLIEFLRFEKIEHLFVFKKEIEILHFKGGENLVEVPKNILFRFKDSTLIHNHPQGTSFSESDIVEAIENNFFNFI